MFDCCWWKLGLPIVRNMSEMAEDSYGLPGLSHITIAGSIMHGFKEVSHLYFHNFTTFLDKIILHCIAFRRKRNGL